MDLKLTTRAQEAMAAAVRRRRPTATRRWSRRTCSRRCSSRPTASPPRCSPPSAPTSPRCRPRPSAALAALPSASGSSVSSPSLGRAAYQALSAAGDVARELGDEYVSTEHLLIGLAPAEPRP